MYFKKLLTYLILLPTLAFSKVNVITTTTDLEWAVKRIGGDLVKVESLLNGKEDPHYVDATPTFISKVANADIFCFIGMDLEVGWAPKVLSRSGNRKVQEGGKGHCETGKNVKAIEVPKGDITRAMGDVHAEGNPHYHLGISKMIEGSEVILEALISVDPKKASVYIKNFESMKAGLQVLKKEISQSLRPLQKTKFMQYHKEFSYFFKEYGIKSLGAVEAVPGVPPSAGRIARVSFKAKRSDVKAVLGSLTSPKRILRKINESVGIKTLQLPLSIMKNTKYNTYESHQRFLAKSLLEVARE